MYYARARKPCARRPANSECFLFSPKKRASPRRILAFLKGRPPWPRRVSPVYARAVQTRDLLTYLNRMVEPDRLSQPHKRGAYGIRTRLVQVDVSKLASCSGCRRFHRIYLRTRNRLRLTPRHGRCTVARVRGEVDPLPPGRAKAPRSKLFTRPKNDPLPNGGNLAGVRFPPPPYPRQPVPVLARPGLSPGRRLTAVPAGRSGDEYGQPDFPPGVRSFTIPL